MGTKRILITNAIPTNNGDAALVFSLYNRLLKDGFRVQVATFDYKRISKLYNDIPIVEDILDTGLTLEFLLEDLKRRNPKSLKVCTFLQKNTPRTKSVIPHYVGFNILDEFVVGYGLDLAERFRNLPMVAIYNP